MTNSEKFKPLAENDAFLEKLISAKTDEEIKSVFKEQDVEISDKEIEELKKDFQQKLSEEVKKLPESELKNIAGGGAIKINKDDAIARATYYGIGSAKSGAGLGAVFGALGGVAKAFLDIAQDEDEGNDTHAPMALKRAFKTVLKGALAGTLAGATIGGVSGAGYGVQRSIRKAGYVGDK